MSRDIMAAKKSNDDGDIEYRKLPIVGVDRGDATFSFNLLFFVFYREGKRIKGILRFAQLRKYAMIE